MSDASSNCEGIGGCRYIREAPASATRDGLNLLIEQGRRAEHLADARMWLLERLRRELLNEDAVIARDIALRLLEGWAREEERRAPHVATDDLTR